MLDTDSVSYVLRGQGKVSARMVEHRPSELCISSITLARLRYGAGRRESAKLHHMIDRFSGIVAVMPFDETCAMQFGLIASDLAERGTPIGDLDAMIAAHALTLEVTLVTNNVKHFDRVRGLNLVNWA
jgi:tRNA(fMet)-specific endonuclease VapC